MTASTQPKAPGPAKQFAGQTLVAFTSSLLPGLLLGGTPSPLPDPHSEPTPVALPPILVTGSLVDPEVPVVPLETIGSRNVFGPDQVRETGAREVNDLIQYLPAISTRPYNGGEASAPSFSMRGLPDDGLTEYIHVLIDGVPASPLPYGWTAFSFLPVTPDRLFAVDYLRGAHSVRYSPNTVGGVLNLMTPPIPKAPVVQTRITAGDYGYLSVLGSAGGTTGPTGLGMSYVYREGDGYREFGGFQQHDLNFKGRHVLDDQSWIAASVSYFFDEHQAPGGLTLAEFETDRFGNARPRNRFSGDRWVSDAVYQRNLEAGGSLVGFVYYSETYRALDAQRPHFGNPDTLLRWTDTSHFLGVGGRVEKPFSLAGLDNTLFAGWRYQREWLPHYRLNSEPFTGGAGTLTQDQALTLDTLSFHIDDTLHLHPRLTANLGVRLEWIPTAQGRDRMNGWDFDDSFFAALPGLGLSYLITDHWSVFGNYFLGFRAPQAWGYGSAAAAGHRLDLEHARSAELGTRLLTWGGRPGNPGDNLVLYTTHDDGRILRHESDPKDDWNTEVIYLGPQGPRGLATGPFGASPELETVAIFGYSRQVELLTRTAQGWQSEVIFEDLDKGHWLASAELDGRNATRELITAGYSGRIVLLSRPPGFGRSELAVAPPENTGGAP